MFMFEKALAGNRRYWIWIGALLAVGCVAFLAYVHEQEVGLAVTGLSRDVVWGLYIGQFVFCVGLGASAVVVVLPYYLHNWSAFRRITLLGEILGMIAVLMAMIFIFVSMGRPMRLLNVILYPHPRSLIFWDLFVLSGYLLLNAVITVTLLAAERDEVEPPKWIKPVIILSIPWAVAIHTVTAFLCSGLAGRPLWLTAIMAPRFLASAFASGSALLILLYLFISRVTRSAPNGEAIRKLAVIVTYAMLTSVFFVLMEFFTAFYSQIPDHMESLRYMYAGLGGHARLAPWMWLSTIMGAVSLVLLLVPRYRRSHKLLAWACGMVFLSLWIDKGIGLIVAAFVPSPLGAVTEYAPSLEEILIALGIWAIGLLILTVLYKIVLSIRESRAEVLP